MNYTKLNIEKTIQTIENLSLRIKDRFPQSGLLSVCNELEQLAIKSKVNIQEINKPYIYFRIIFYFLIIVILLSLLYFFTFIKINYSFNSINDIISIGDSLLNEIVAISAAFYFLYKFEETLKQKIILKALHELRSISHVIDMHQLTKDPTSLVIEKTINSPTRELSPYQLNRYLDYCSELLALCSKIAAIYGNDNRDELILENIQDIEILTSSLSRKIWNKIMLINNNQ
jgi:hypothetical protein